MRAGPWRRLSTKELTLSNCGAGEDSWESLEQPGISNKSILKEINSEYSLEGLMQKLKPQYFGYLIWRANLLEKTLDSGKGWVQEEKGATEDELVGWHHWLNGQEFEQILGNSKGQGNLAAHGFTKSRIWLSKIFGIKWIQWSPDICTSTISAARLIFWLQGDPTSPFWRRSALGFLWKEWC